MTNTFGNFEVYRPEAWSERIVRQAAEAHLRARFESKRYVNVEDIDSILKHQIGFYGKRLDQILPLIASQHFIEFILDQYEIASQIHSLYENNELTDAKSKQWQALEINWRRTLKYLAERCTLIADKIPAPKIGRAYLMSATDEALICAEQLVSYCILSDQTRLIFPNSTVMTIHGVGTENYIEHEVEDAERINFWQRMDRDKHGRSAFVTGQLPEFDLEQSASYLDNPLFSTIGVDLKTSIALLRNLRDGCRPPKKGFQIPFCNAEKVMSSRSIELSVPIEAVSLVVKGFSICRARMETEGRDFWNPKYKFRAFRRGIFEFPHETGIHYVFSKSMFTESLLMLLAGFTYKQIPDEWISNPVDKATSNLSLHASKWFEKQVQVALQTSEIEGRSFTRHIGHGDHRIPIPDLVGELDFLGFSKREGLLFLAECKRTQPGAEPKLWRRDKSDFLEKKGNYVEKFKKKIQWVAENSLAVIDALVSEGIIENTNNAVSFAACMLTMYPTIVSYSIKDFPCVSITEFCLDYQEATSYPYQNTIKPL